jgi:hypothetical protein
MEAVAKQAVAVPGAGDLDDAIAGDGFGGDAAMGLRHGEGVEFCVIGGPAIGRKGVAIWGDGSLNLGVE